MPYINPQRRSSLEGAISQTVAVLGPNPPWGWVNYTITTLLDRCCASPFFYNDINNIIGILECIKLEFYRRVAVPYEDKKKEENGEVYKKR